METYSEKRHLIPNPHFSRQRQQALGELAGISIEEPIEEIIRNFAKLPFCFTLQSCYGHFLFEGQTDPNNLAPLPVLEHEMDIEYRIAYLALCVEDNPAGRSLLNELAQLCRLDPKNIQFGSADWFWERQVNSYIVQVEPERFKDRDRCVVRYPEALHLEKIRAKFFKALGGVLKK